MAGMSTPRTNESRRRAAAIRAWAVDNGFTVAEGGRIPAAVTAAYDAAHAEPNGAASPAPGPAGDDDQGAADESGPEWDDGDQGDGPQFGPLPLADLGPPPLDGDQSAQDDQSGPPPPASLAEARERAQGQQSGRGSRKRRAPGWAAAESIADRAGPRVKTTIKVTKAVQQDIEGKLTLLLSVPVMAWETADPYCGGAAADRLERMIQTAVPLICQSPDAVKMFTRGTTWMLWLEFLVAIAPVGGAVYQHHVAHTVELERAPEPEQAGPPPGQQYPSVFTGHVPAPQPV
jgi:hypothetical protein